MGLDMYLEKHIFIGGSYDDDISGTCVIKHGPTFEKGRELDIDVKDISSIDLRIGYWRKANAIHFWIVENCYNGNYEDYHGNDLYFSEAKMEILLDTINDVLADHKKAEHLLPVKDGFFFGSQEYDKWYFEDLEYTKEVLEKCINDPDPYKTFYYSASW